MLLERVNTSFASKASKTSKSFKNCRCIKIFTTRSCQLFYCLYQNVV